MNIPESVDISGLNYKVEVTKSGCKDDNYMGRTYEKECLIMVCSDMPKDQMEVTFLHEVIHAVGFAFALELSENQVTALASGLYSTLKKADIIK